MTLPLKPDSEIVAITRGYYYGEYHLAKKIHHLPVVDKYLAEILQQLGDLSFYELLPEHEILRHLANGELILFRRKYEH